MVPRGRRFYVRQLLWLIRRRQDALEITEGVNPSR
jgi:hypothetical protein